MKTFIDALEKIEISETRIYDLNRACNEIHKAVSQLDKGNLSLLNKHYPEVIKVAELYGKNNACLNSDFSLKDSVKPGYNPPSERLNVLLNEYHFTDQDVIDYEQDINDYDACNNIK